MRSFRHLLSAGLALLAVAPAVASAQQLAIHRAEVDEIAGTLIVVVRFGMSPNAAPGTTVPVPNTVTAD